MGVLLVVLVAAYMRLPLIVVAGASVNENRFLTCPPSGFTLDWYVDALTSETYVEPFQLSLLIGVLVALLAGAVGTAAALALTRFRVPGAALIQGLLMSPLTIPTIILHRGAVCRLGHGRLAQHRHAGAGAHRDRDPLRHAHRDRCDGRSEEHT